MSDQKITISVIGGHKTTKKVDKLAFEVGKMIAELNCVLVCGGLDGVMRSAAMGAKSAGGLTIGLLPGKNKSDANQFIDIALPTTIGYARNAMVACSADIIIALPGSHGTLSEICYGLVYKRPVLDLGGWRYKGMIRISSLKDAEKKLKALVRTLR